MYCPNCGNKLIDNANFCSVCGRSTQEIFEIKNNNLDLENSLKHYSKKKNTTLWIIVLASVVALGLFIFGVISIYLMMVGSPQKISKKAIESYYNRDYDTLIDCTSDETYEKIYELISCKVEQADDWQCWGLDGNIKNGKDLKKEIYNSLILHNQDYFDSLENAGVNDYNYNIVLEYKNSKNVSREELDDYLSKYSIDYENDIKSDNPIYIDSYAILNNYQNNNGVASDSNDYLFSFMDYYDNNKFCIVEYNVKTSLTYNINEEKTESDFSGSVFDVCYKSKGKWYSTYWSRVSGFDHNISIERVEKQNDIDFASVISTAIQASLANENSYDEIVNELPDDPEQYCIIASASPGTSFVSIDGKSYDTFLSELNNNIGGVSPNIKYDKEDAAYWTIGLTGDGKPVVFISTTEGGQDWEILPQTDKKYVINY